MANTTGPPPVLSSPLPPPFVFLPPYPPPDGDSGPFFPLLAYYSLGVVVAIGGAVAIIAVLFCFCRKRRDEERRRFHAATRRAMSEVVLAPWSASRATGTDHITEVLLVIQPGEAAGTYVAVRYLSEEEILQQQAPDGVKPGTGRVSEDVASPSGAGGGGGGGGTSGTDVVVVVLTPMPALDRPSRGLPTAAAARPNADGDGAAVADADRAGDVAEAANRRRSLPLAAVAPAVGTPVGAPGGSGAGATGSGGGSNVDSGPHVTVDMQTLTSRLSREAPAGQRDEAAAQGAAQPQPL